MSNYAPSYKHQDIEQLFDRVYWVHGSIKLAPGMYMNRNMVIVKETDDLYLINPIRLDNEAENKLNKLGKVKAIIRLGDFHGIDDQYYIDTYRCEFWCQPGQQTYPEPKPSQTIISGTPTPMTNASFFVFEKALFPEAALLLENEKLIVTTDSIQHWSDWQHMSFLGKSLLLMMGFRLGTFIGIPWLKRVSPKDDSLASDFKRLLDLDFTHLIAAHGRPILNHAKQTVEQIVSEKFPE